MEYPVCKLWLILTRKYQSLQPFKKFAKEYSLPYHKVREYGSNTFKKFDHDFAKNLCNILGCEFEELFIDDKEDYFARRKPDDRFKTNEGVVYFVKNSDGHTKIGRTQDLKRRLLSLKSDKRGYGLQLIHFIKTEDIKVLEKTLHRIFVDKRIEGEWFNLSDEDLEKIKKA